ncbi:MAG: hypothetical protein AAFY98_06870 [Verrucomicrobiota bacterium]
MRRRNSSFPCFLFFLAPLLIWGVCTPANAFNFNEKEAELVSTIAEIEASLETLPPLQSTQRSRGAGHP